MRRLAVALTFAVATQAAAQTAAKPTEISLEVRSTAPGQVLTVDVMAHDGASYGLAVYNGAPGSVSQTGLSGKGTTPLIISMSPSPGRIRVQLGANFPEIRVFVQGDTAHAILGHNIDIVRDSLGGIKLISTNGSKRK